MISVKTMNVAAESLWDLTLGRPTIDPEALAIAIEHEMQRPDRDYRTRLLIRDSLNALTDFWGRERFDRWLERASQRDQLIAIWRSDLGPAGFSTLRGRMMQATQRQTVLEFLRELGTRISKPARIAVGGQSH